DLIRHLQVPRIRLLRGGERFLVRLEDGGRAGLGRRGDDGAGLETSAQCHSQRKRDRRTGRCPQYPHCPTVEQRPDRRTSFPQLGIRSKSGPSPGRRAYRGREPIDPHRPKEKTMAQQLTGSVAFLLTDGFEDVELTEPWKAVTDAGATAVLVSPKA